MADVTDFTTWSSTAASNSPSGSTTIGAGLDDNLRQIQAEVAKWRDGTGYGILTVTSVGGTANAITGNTSPAPTLAANQKFLLVPSSSNSAATTLALNSGTAKNVFYAGAACVGGELPANIPQILEYDGTQYNILGAVDINALTADGSPDPNADYVMTYDASATAFKKVLVRDIQHPIQGTAVASTSGTTVSFTSLPSGLKRITFLLKDVSTNGTSSYMIQLSSSATFKTTGYEGGAVASGGTSTAASGAGLPITVNATAADTYKGVVTLVNESGNTWVYEASILMESGTNTIADFYTSAGYVTLAGTLDGIRITTVSGDTFDNGEVNIVYE